MSLYIDCYDQQYKISKKDEKQNYSRPLVENYIQMLTELFSDKNIPFSTKEVAPKVVEEELCNKRVVVTIGEDKFYLYRIGETLPGHYDIMMVPESKAVKIVAAFMQKGIEATLEECGKNKFTKE